MHSTTKVVLFFIGGILLGVVLCAAIFIVFLKSDIGKNAVRAYFSSVALTGAPVVSSNDIPNNPVQPAATSSSTVLVPKSFVTQQYYLAINKVVPDFNSIITVSNNLQPLLATINTQSLSGNYDGILDKIVDAKNLIAQEKTINLQLGQDILLLKSANQSTTDSATKAQTGSLLPQLTTLQTDLSTYLGMLDTLLSGTTPTSAQVQATLTQAAKVGEDMVSAKTSLQSLLRIFADGVAAAH